MKQLRAVVLLSGGIDSAATLAIARKEGFAAHALTFDYGQRHSVEVAAARKIAASLGATEHKIISINLRQFGGSALTAAIRVPKTRSREEIGKSIPVTYVPARNTIFLSYALAWAEVLGARDIFIGVNSVDFSGYPDCRPAFIKTFEMLANLGTKAGVEGKKIRVRTPLMRLKKSEIIRKGASLGVDFSLTRSCYDPLRSGRPCGHCDSCLIRGQGFKEAGIVDPLLKGV